MRPLGLAGRPAAGVLKRLPVTQVHPEGCPFALVSLAVPIFRLELETLYKCSFGHSVQMFPSAHSFGFNEYQGVLFSPSHIAQIILLHVMFQSFPRWRPSCSETYR